MDDALPPPPAGLEVEWDHERVQVRSGRAPAPPQALFSLGEVLLLAIAWVAVGHGVAAGGGAPWVAKVAWITALPAAALLALWHQATSELTLELCCAPTTVEARLRYGQVTVLTRIQPMDELRQVTLHPSRHAGGAPVLRFHARRKTPLDVKLVGFDRVQARWIWMVVDAARRRHARFREEALARGEGAAAIEALRHRASGGSET